MFPRFVRVVAGVGTPSSSRLNDTPLCGWTAFAYPASHRWALGWLPLLAVGDGAAVNVGVQVSVGVLTILGKHQEMELLDRSQTLVTKSLGINLNSVTSRLCGFGQGISPSCA